MGLFTFDGRGGVSDEEVALGTPDMSEAKSLTHHVNRCAMRYKMFTKRQALQGTDIMQIKYLLVVLVGTLLLTSSQAREVFSWAIKLV